MFAKDDVDDILKEMGPKAAKEKYSIDETMWKLNIQVPACLVVGTMNQLSTWGFAMGISTIGCWSFVLGLMPRAASAQHTGLNIALVVIAVFPVMTALAPAAVSSACDDLLNQLNDISFIGDQQHKLRCMNLRHSLTWLNRGQGLVRTYHILWSTNTADDPMKTKQSSCMHVVRRVFVFLGW